MNSLKSIKPRIIGLSALCALFVILYFIFFSLNPLILTILVIGSVAVVSTATLYTVVQHIAQEDERERESWLQKGAKKGTKGAKGPKLSKTPKTIRTPKQKFEETEPQPPDIIDKYMEAIPRLKDYLETDVPYEDIAAIRELIFASFTEKELAKINLLDLSDFDKLQFIREMLYYTEEERKQLMDIMLRYKGRDDAEILYVSPSETMEIGQALRTYIISLVGTGEKRKLLIVDTTESISSVKERAGELFDYDLNDFLISSGGLILNENAKIEDYNIDDEDEIVLIPQRKEEM
ncbi:MAG: hypothetical protein ACTSR8_14605 [Promethearchaeota archaeon]